MRTDQVITRRGVLRGAGVAATGVAVAALGVSSAAAEPREHGSPLGSWFITVTGPGFPKTSVVASFAAGGVYTAIDLNPPSLYTALGTWARTGEDTFINTFWQLAPNTFLQGGPDQVAFRVTSAGRVSGDDVSSDFTFEVFVPSQVPPGGKPFFTGGKGHAKGSRLRA